MKRFLFAAALVALVASVGTAQEAPAAPAPVAAPVVVTTAGTPVAEYAPAQPQRRGLFGRFRNRNSGTTTYAPATPVMTAPITAPITTPANVTPMPATVPPQPMPMPGPRTGAAPAPTNGIVQATGDLPDGTYTTTDGTIIQIGGTQTSGAQIGDTLMATQPVMAQPTAETQSSRRGLFGRLRNR